MHTDKEIKSMWFKALFWLTVYIAIFSTGLISDIKLNGFMAFFSILIGSFLFIYSLALTMIAGRTLKKFAHTKEGEFIPDRFIDRGIYGCMRHPMHLGIGLLPLAIALMSANSVIILASGWGLAATFGFVLLIEEPEAIEKYQDQYIDYMKKTPAFSISLQCVMNTKR